jgi:thioredoxin 1
LQEKIMSTIRHLTTADFLDEVIHSDVAVLVDFYADWCGPCRMLALVLEGLARELAGQVKIVKVNVDDEPELAQHFRVQSIPTLLTFRDGQLVDRLVGIGSPGELRRTLARLAGPQANQRVRVR